MGLVEGARLLANATHGSVWSTNASHSDDLETRKNCVEFVLLFAGVHASVSADNLLVLARRLKMSKIIRSELVGRVGGDDGLV